MVQPLILSKPGTPEPFNVIACGKYYSERLDDVAWENDLGGFRAYGPALQARGERGFGYDLFTKYNTTEPILESLYAEELNPEKRAKIAELKKTDPKAASELQKLSLTISIMDMAWIAMPLDLRWVPVLLL